MDTTLTDRAAGISVRLSRPSDLLALRALLDRCSAETLYRRFHGTIGRSVQRELARIATPTPTHRSWVAVGDDGAVHGTATLAWGRDGEVEVAFLVEDAFQRRGIGRALVGAASDEAARRGVPEVVANIQGDNSRAARFLRAVVPEAALAFDDGMTVGTIPVPRRPLALTGSDPSRPVRTSPGGRPMTRPLTLRRRRSRPRSALAEVPGAPACPSPVRDALAHHTDVFEPRRGAILAHEGSTAREVVIIVEGEVRLERGGRPAGCLKAGASFGGHEVLTGTPHRYTVVAGGGVELRVVDAPAFLAAAERLPLLTAPLRPAC